MANVVFSMGGGGKTWEDGDLLLAVFEFPHGSRVEDVDVWKGIFTRHAMHAGWKWKPKGSRQMVPMTEHAWAVVNGLIYQLYKGRRVVEVIIVLGGDGHGNYFTAGVSAILG